MSMHLLITAAHLAGPYECPRAFSPPLLCYAAQMADWGCEAPRTLVTHTTGASLSNRHFTGKPHVNHTQVHGQHLYGPRLLACSP